MFSPRDFWPGSYTGAKARVNCVNSQVALDDTAERKSVHVKHAHVVDCVEAERENIWQSLNREAKKLKNYLKSKIISCWQKQKNEKVWRGSRNQGWKEKGKK